MNGKQRAFLRKMSQSYPVVVYIGKEGISLNVIDSVKQALEARELIKCSVQQNSDISAREASDMLCSELGAEGISCAGRKFVIYKQSEKKIIEIGV